MVTDCTALLGGDKLTVFSDVGMAGVALNFLFHKMAFMGEIEAEDLGADFIDSRMAVGAFRRNDFGFYGHGFGDIG